MAVNENYLVLTALGPDQLGLVKALARLCATCGCNIIDSRMTSAGQAFAMILHLSGSWSAIAKLEAALPSLSKKQDLTIHTKRTQPKDQTYPILPYAIQIIGLDKPGVLSEIAHFFVDEGIMIHTLAMDTQTLPSSHSQIISINLTIKVPAKTHLASLRERFLEYCEDRNLDALMEPECA